MGRTGSISARSPFTEHVGIDVQPSASGIGVVELPASEHLNNHVGSRHAGALFATADAAGAALLESTFSTELVSSLHVQEERIVYERMAKGPVRASARLADGGAVSAIAADAADGFDVEVSITDEDGKAVAHTTLRYGLSESQPAAPASSNGNGHHPRGHR